MREKGKYTYMSDEGNEVDETMLKTKRDCEQKIDGGF